jgi:hypothetical protein
MISRKSVPKAPGMEVPLVGKFLLVAGYCASYNPAKSDMRLFGRATGPDRRLKKGGGTRRAGYGRVRIGKVCPHFTCLELMEGTTKITRTQTIPYRSIISDIRSSLRREWPQARLPPCNS